MTEQIESWFRQLPGKLQRELATKFRARVENARVQLAAAAPFKTGATRGSVRVQRKRGELDVEILAGGAATTRTAVRTARYVRPVALGSGDTAGIARTPGGAGVTYDYALAGEFGTEHQAAKPWFYETWFGGLKDQTAQGIADDVADIVSRA